MSISDLPTVNASLNGLSAVLLCVGYGFIRRGRVAAHRACMTAAFVSSTLFLATYLYYHAQVGSKPFTGTGSLRTFYLGLLLSHTVLAAALPFAAIATLRLAVLGAIDRHRRLARVTLPAWLYVSLTGVAIYVMLYHLAP